MGLENVDIVPRTSDVYADIQAFRGIIPLCRFDNKTKIGYGYLRDYRREYDEKNRCFKETPLHDICSHSADAARMTPYIYNKATRKINFKAKVAYGGGW